MYTLNSLSDWKGLKKFIPRDSFNSSLYILFSMTSTLICINFQLPYHNTFFISYDIVECLPLEKQVFAKPVQKNFEKPSEKNLLWWNYAKLNLRFRFVFCYSFSKEKNLALGKKIKENCCTLSDTCGTFKKSQNVFKVFKRILLLPIRNYRYTFLTSKHILDPTLKLAWSAPVQHDSVLPSSLDYPVHSLPSTF